VVQFDFCRAPEQQIYFILDDGTMAVLLYDTVKEIVGWYRLKHGCAAYESVISVSTASGEHIYTLMNDGVSRWIERMDEDLAVQNAELVTFTAGNGTVSNRLFGEDVQIQEAGEVKASDAGAVYLKDLADEQIVGRGFTSRFETMPLSPGAELGPGLLKQKQIVEVYLLIHQGRNFWIGTIEEDDDDLDFVEDYCEKAGIRSGWEADSGIKILRDKPWPVEISAIMPEVEVNEI